MDPFALPQLLVTKKLELKLGDYYRILGPDGQFVLLAHRAGFKLKEDVRIYLDEGKSQEILRIQARQVFDFSATYDVTDSRSGALVGSLQRSGMKSMFRDEWNILGPAGESLGTVREDNMAMALIRRFVASLVPQQFDVEMNGQKVADIRQKFNPLIFQLEVDFTPDHGKRLDRRLGLAIAIVMAAIEGRQEGS